MVTARLFDRPPEEDAGGLGDYEFEILPRSGERIVLRYRGRAPDQYEVAHLEHTFADHTKPPLIAIMLRRLDEARAFRSDDIDAVFSGEH
jgi:hypothetical protein